MCVASPTPTRRYNFSKYLLTKSTSISRNQRNFLKRIMATVIPVDLNKCWFCNHHNLSAARVCERCSAHVTPTLVNGEKLDYCIFSFGSLATDFGCEKLDASLLTDAMSSLQSRQDKPVVIRSGIKEIKAILCKDLGGNIRMSLEGVPAGVATATGVGFTVMTTSTGVPTQLPRVGIML